MLVAKLYACPTPAQRTPPGAGRPAAEGGPVMNREQPPYLRKVAANGRSPEMAKRRGGGVIGPRSAAAQASGLVAECLLLEMVSGAGFMLGQWWTVSF